ncbi:permease prefix domain 1-containing protein [Amnibacterium flavum]|uniref:Uncharacterized protein n=1 Tax=Amnibacterium flavum TaxID=2173173 RepID=A0A2V1HPT6_9MICO|nr:permease prefix domain 1-containing protein [Amnibacterium flavum]PVZ93622.1 hypothetical protein DDQ50_15060 [Amnibacterium flavum]
MNVVIAYLDTMFSAYPQSPRMLEAKAELQGMMEDAYTGLIAEGRSENEAVGQVIRDFGNLEEVAPVLGIASDITREPAAATSGSFDASTERPVVQLDQAQGYADALQRIRFRFTTAVVLFVLSPAALIGLPAAAGSGSLPIGGHVGLLIGLVVLFIMVAIGVTLLVSTSRETAPYKRISDGQFSVGPGVTRWAETLAEANDRSRIRALQFAIGLWILAPIPLIAFALLSENSPQGDFLPGVGVVLVLVLVAAGLGIFLPHTWSRTLVDDLGRGAGAGAADDDERGIVGVIAAFYWPLLTAIFLAWSFIGSAWHISWIVWPVGAVLFGAIAGGISALESYRRARR